MKTTVHLPDALVEAAKAAAAEDGRTLRDLVEEGPRGVLSARGHRRPFTLPDASVGGSGLQAGRSWELPRDLAYDPELWTADRDFGRFPDLATRNPLVG